MTPDELKAALIADGWKIEKNHNPNSGVDWHAYRRFDDWPDCECNDKPPALCIEPWWIDEHGGYVNFRVVGKVGDNWVDLCVYSVRMDDCMATIPYARKVLGAAWRADVSQVDSV